MSVRKTAIIVNRTRRCAYSNRLDFVGIAKNLKGIIDRNSCIGDALRVGFERIDVPFFAFECERLVGCGAFIGLLDKHFDKCERVGRCFLGSSRVGQTTQEKGL